MLINEKITNEMIRGAEMAIKKRRLGKGLDSLIGIESAGDEAENAGRSGEGIVEIPPAKIELNPYQPRQVMDRAGLEELADSIAGAGVIQPVSVRPAGDGMYELIMGERRLRAARMAGLETVPAIVRDAADAQMIEFALIENVQRRDLNAIEKADALRRMCEELEITQQEAAEKIGLKRSTVTNLIRLLELPDEVREMVSRGTLSAGHARAVLSVDGASRRLALARKIIDKAMSVRAAEREAAAMNSDTGGSDAPSTRKSRGPSPHTQRLQAVLSESLHADVEIKSNGKKGKIVIKFDDHEEFERLYELFTDSEGLPV